MFSVNDFDILFGSALWSWSFLLWITFCYDHLFEEILKQLATQTLSVLLKWKSTFPLILNICYVYCFKFSEHFKQCSKMG